MKFAAVSAHRSGRATPSLRDDRKRQTRKETGREPTYQRQNTVSKTPATSYERPIVNRYVGSLLRRLGIALYKSNGISAVVPGQGERLAALYARYGVAPSRELGR